LDILNKNLTEKKIPRIGISFRIVNAIGYEEKRDAISHDWPKFLEKINVLPIWIPNTISNIDSFFNELDIDGIILSGGDDIGQTPERDKTETSLINYGIKYNLPIIGVCRGMQILNQYFNGSLKKSISKTHVGKEHSLIIREKFFLNTFPSEIIVNSFHDNIITSQNLGKNLTSFAETKSDKTIEGFFHNTFPILGVMWHPEREQKRFDELLIKNFLKKNE
jgi:N5-(cytidine 5'-diphosphoramidyl)-L-glutamine hydrolase